jgi:hypothetical protein
MFDLPIGPPKLRLTSPVELVGQPEAGTPSNSILKIEGGLVVPACVRVVCKIGARVFGLEKCTSDLRPISPQGRKPAYNLILD